MLRTIYLQKSLSVNGRSALAGRALFDRFRELSDEIILGHAIFDDEVYSQLTDPVLRQDILSYELIRQFRPNLVYIEGGLFANKEGQWKIPRHLAEEISADAGVVVIADADVNKLYEQKDQYRAAASFLRASAQYGENDSPHPVYASDQKSYWKGYRQILCKPEKMVLSEWLRPVYDEIPAILVGGPVRLASWESLVASCNRDTTGTLHLDVWVDMIEASPFGSVAQSQGGFVVFITGAVSDDVWLEGCPHNTTWLTRLSQFLVEHSKRDKDRRASHWRSPNLLFLSHRSVDKAVVRGIASALKVQGVGVWFDEEQLIPSQSLVEEIDHGLGKMTHYAIFWSKNCVNAPWVRRELNAAISRLIEQRMPLLIVRLDDTPVPSIIADIFRIEAAQCLPKEIASRLADAITRLSARR